MAVRWSRRHAGRLALGEHDAVDADVQTAARVADVDAVVGIDRLGADELVLLVEPIDAVPVESQQAPQRGDIRVTSREARLFPWADPKVEELDRVEQRVWLALSDIREQVHPHVIRGEPPFGRCARLVQQMGLGGVSDRGVGNLDAHALWARLEVGRVVARTKGPAVGILSPGSAVVSE